MCWTPTTIFCGWNWPAIGERPLGDVLGEVADALDVARDADRRDRLAQVDRQRLAAGDHQDRVLLDLPLQHVEPRVGRDDGLGERRIAAHERADGVDEHLLGDAAHLGDAAAQVLKLGVVGADDMFRHGASSSSGRRQPKRPVM